MNILHIHTTDRMGGAAVAMHRLHEAFRRCGLGSRILCGYKVTGDPDAQELMPGPLARRLNREIGGMFHRLGMEAFGYPASWALSRHPWLQWADVVMLRNLHGGYLSLGALGGLAERRPVIWRLPDMWSFTGHCTYSHDCRRWLLGCGECPRLDEPPALPFDTTNRLYRWKQRLYSRYRNRLHLVSPSLWLKSLVERSPLFRGWTCHHIPTAVDLDVFQPVQKDEARKALGLPLDGTVVMTGGFHLDDPRKETARLVRVMGILRRTVDPALRCLIVGGNPQTLRNGHDPRDVFTGRIETDERLNLCYNAADVFVHLSTADNMPNTLVEAAAAGCPAVTSDVGGCPEVVADGTTGFVVATEDELILRLKQLLADGHLRWAMGRAARARAAAQFGMEQQVEAYRSLIALILSKNDRIERPCTVGV